MSNYGKTIASRLIALDAAMKVLGMRNPVLLLAAKTLNRQAIQIREYKAHSHYKAGHKAGMEEAFLSGLPSDEHDGRGPG